jgi:predicted Zn finger-like uncharacterized protein
MALATICPHCSTTFRVASDQLKLRGGIVRCGACNEVFDGNAALIDLAALAAHEADAEAAAALAAPAPDPPSDEARQEEPIYTLDFDTTFDPFGMLPKSLHPTPATEPPPVPDTAAITGTDPVVEQQVDEEILALPLLDDEFEAPDAPPAPPATPARDESVDFQPPLLMRASAAAAPVPPAPLPWQQAVAQPARHAGAKRRKIEPVLVAPAPLAAPTPGEHEPEFVKQIRLKERTGPTRRIVMGAGSALLVLALAAQGVVAFRNVLAARYPQARPLLAGACAVLGCKVELPAQIDALSVETGELQSLGATTFSLTTLLRNQGSLAQAWPHLELALTDANDKPLVRRVFTPAEYLPPGVAPAKGFGPRSEQPVKLFFELNQLKASGYHIAIFYP